MMKTGVSTSEIPVLGYPESLLIVIRTLKALSEADPAFADQYLHRGEYLLSQVLPRAQYERLRHDREDLPGLRAALRQAIDKADWPRAHSLAEEAEARMARVSSSGPILELADAVYGPRVLYVSPVTLALNGLTSHLGPALERERAHIVENLRSLTARDVTWKAFYDARAEHFDRIKVALGDETLLVDREELLRRIRQAVERSNFPEVRRLTEALAHAAGAGPVGRVRPTIPSTSGTEPLARDLPAAAVRRGHDLGLAPETVPSAPGIRAYLSCGCGDCPTFPERPLSEGDRTVSDCRTCGHAGPAGLSPSLRENLDLLLLHPFMTSAGTRYLPWFGEEALLVETFPETAPDTQTPLLGQLGLTQRRGLPRLVIEDAVRVHTARICEDLGLDPFEFTLACVPFDVFCRLAARYGWGRDHLWTHFDGYQVTRDLNLVALVGGDARYGGPDDFCAVQRNYDSAKITARFCVLRRNRFLPAGKEIDGVSGAAR